MNGAVPGVRDGGQPARVWRLQDAVPGMLHTSGAQYAPRKASGGSNARGYRSGEGLALPGGRPCVRSPDIDETPLSRDEIWHGLIHGLIYEAPRLPELMQAEIEKHRATKKEQAA